MLQKEPKLYVWQREREMRKEAEASEYINNIIIHYMRADINTLDIELTQQSNMLRTERLDVSFGEILNMYEH